MDALDRTKVLALIRHLRARAGAGLEILPERLATRFRLDPFVVARLIEAELGGARAERVPIRPVAAHRAPTRELAPGSGRGVVE